MKIFIVFLLIALHLSSYDRVENGTSVYYESTHFRTVFDLSYESNTSITLAHSYLDTAELSWSQTVEVLGFKEPRNTDTKKIDIYFGNHSVARDTNNSIDTISTFIDEYSLAGYAWYYISDRTPYFVMNTKLTEDQFKVTISHEFFHTVQYAYFIDDALTDTKFYKNIWWLEATATLMEDEVYDTINDYIRFLDPFFENSHYSFELQDGSHEYAMVIFAKYIREKYGFQIIKDSLSIIETSAEDVGYFEILDNLLIQDYNSNMQVSINEFAKWVVNADVYFEEGDLYPPLKNFTPAERSVIGKGGIKVVDNLKSGWNMVTLSSSDVNSLEIDSLESIWAYQSGIWSNSIENEISNVQSSQGYWVKTSAVSSLYYTYFDNGENDISTLNEEWHLFGTTEQLSMDYFDTQNIIVWHYSEGVWYAFSNDSSISDTIEKLGYKQLNSIQAYSSYWIKKI